MPTNFKADILSNQQPATANPAGLVNASIEDGKRRAAALQMLGDVGIDAYKGYSEAGLEKNIKAIRDEYIASRDPNKIQQLQDDVRRSELDVNTSAPTIFNGDMAPQMTVAEKDLAEKKARLKAAMDQKVMSRDEALTRMSKELRKAIADAPGFADSFRKIASELTGVGGLEHYEFTRSMQEEEAAKAAQKEREMAGLKFAEKDINLIVEAGLASHEDAYRTLTTNPKMFGQLTHQALINKALSAQRQAAEDIVKTNSANSSIVRDQSGVIVNTEVGKIFNNFVSGFTGALAVKKGDMSAYFNAQGQLDLDKVIKDSGMLDEARAVLLNRYNAEWTALETSLDGIAGLTDADRRELRAGIQTRRTAFDNAMKDNPSTLTFIKGLMDNAKKGQEFVNGYLANFQQAVNILGGPSELTVYNAEGYDIYSKRSPEHARRAAVFKNMQTTVGVVPDLNVIQVFSQAVQDVINKGGELPPLSTDPAIAKVQASAVESVAKQGADLIKSMDTGGKVEGNVKDLTSKIASALSMYMENPNGDVGKYVGGLATSGAVTRALAVLPEGERAAAIQAATDTYNRRLGEPTIGLVARLIKDVAPGTIVELPMPSKGYNDPNSKDYRQAAKGTNQLEVDINTGRLKVVAYTEDGRRVNNATLNVHTEKINKAIAFMSILTGRPIKELSNEVVSQYGDEAKASSEATAAKPKPPNTQTTPNEFSDMQVPPAVQAQRDDDRKTLLKAEVVRARQLIQAAKTAEEKKVAENYLSAINTELSRIK